MDHERDEIGDLMARAFADSTKDERAGGRAAAIRAGNRIEAARRRSRSWTASRGRPRLALLGLGWLAAAAWVARSIVSLAAGPRPAPLPALAREGVDAAAGILAVTPVQLLAGLALLSLATLAAVRLAVADD